VRILYDDNYSYFINFAEEEDSDRDFLQKYLNNLMSNKIKDEFEDYIKSSRVPKLDISVYNWWKTQDHIPSMRKMAYDHLCVPAMSSEIERCFRSTKSGISETRKRLDWAVIEASEVSRGLMKYGVL
jgi:hAT family C-terminal dimerisation region